MADNNNYREAILALEVAGLNFANSWINDTRVRQEYIRRTQSMSQSLREAVSTGAKSPRQAAKIASEMRNEIMEAARQKTSSLGLAKAKNLKAKGLAFDDLVKKYANRKFSKPFEQLTKGQQDEVLMDIVSSAGKANPKVNLRVKRLGAAARGLWVISIAVAVYNVGSAENKVDAAGREATSLAGGIAGGAATGAAAGIWLGPIGVGVGIAIGGALGAIMADRAYVEIRGQSDNRVGAIIDPNINMLWADEAAIANSLVSQAGIDTILVRDVFNALSRDHSGNADDVARLYVDLVKKKKGSLEHAVKLDRNLRIQLVNVMESGWTSGFERQQINYLNSL